MIHDREMRMAETRWGWTRALREASAVPLCSAEEIGSFGETARRDRESEETSPTACPTGTTAALKSVIVFAN